MSNKITPDIFLSMEFEEPKNMNYYKYLDYIFDESKTQTKVYESYHNYMFDESKTDSLFTKNKDILNDDEIQNQKELFSLAQKDGSFLWKPVISFNNEFLIKNKILVEDKVNDKKLKECARKSIEKMLELENIKSYTYSGAIHYNTDNIHIHLAVIEVGTPTRKYIDDKSLTKNERCKNAFFKKLTFEKGKSVINKVLSNDIENLKELSFLSRKKIIDKISFKDKTFTPEEINLLREIKEKLPLNQSQWQYNNKKLDNVRPLLNKFTTSFLYNNFPKEIKKLKDELKQTEELYTKRYGKGKYEHNFYSKNKLDELYVRSANKVLKILKDFNLDYKNLDRENVIDEKSVKKDLGQKNPLDNLSNGKTEDKIFLTEDKKLEIYFSLFEQKLKEIKQRKKQIKVAKNYIKTNISNNEIYLSNFKTEEEKEIIEYFCKNEFDPENETQNILLNKLTNMRLDNRYRNYTKKIFDNNDFSKREQKEIYKDIFKFQKDILSKSIEKVKEQYEKLGKKYLESNKNLDTAKYQVSIFSCFKNMFSDFEQMLQEESFNNLMRYRELVKETALNKQKSLEK
ncbi:MAG: MobP2 family relaxase [Parvimonas sp.]|uniref:MobP2 family relaxase n=1 Tax=Parvimonas sp. TaxID=1944660 RepID=UPI002A765DF3|nr:MobP2 family relaxase [Parvimonas sp.]MDY3050726.1 MobP2 family relaxase [Parvimonas sp.]